MPKTISEHAAYELTKAGIANSEDNEDRQTAINLMALVRRFEKQKNTERQKDFILMGLSRILNFLPLTPLTDDPDEWEKFEIERKNVDTQEVEKKIVWQSRRATSIFSEDQGKTWFDQASGKTGSSLDHVAEAQRIVDEKKAAEERKAEAVARAQKPIGLADPEAPAGEVPLAPGVASNAEPEHAERGDSVERPDAGTKTDAK